MLPGVTPRAGRQRYISEVRVARSLYQVLQVDPEAEPDVVEAVYRRLARKYHPDVSGVPDAAERMKEINAAYQVLRDPGRRCTASGTWKSFPWTAKCCRRSSRIPRAGDV